MNRKLKFFLISFGIALIFSFVWFGYLLDIGGFTAFIGLMYTPIILIILLLIFLVVAVNKSEKGEKLKSAFIVAIGFILAVGLIYGGFVLNEWSKDYKLHKICEESSLTIKQAIDANDVSLCNGLTSADCPSIDRDDCYLWVAYETNNYSLCEEMTTNPYAPTNQKDCWLTALVKTKQRDYCEKFDNETDKEECLVIFARFSNETFIRNYNPEDYRNLSSSLCEKRSADPARCDYDYDYYITMMDYNPNFYLKK